MSSHRVTVSHVTNATALKVFLTKNPLTTYTRSDSKFVFARRYSFLLPFCSYGFRAPGLETDDGFYGKQVLPAFGFTSHTLTQSAREDAFSRSSPHRKPEAKRACAVMQARRAAPQDPFEDPLISACLILMAQSQVKFAQKHPTCLPADKFPVRPPHPPHPQNKKRLSQLGFPGSHDWHMFLTGLC